MASSILESTSVFPDDEKRKKLAAANTKFALNLYKHLVVGNKRNLFMSPLSISAALAMTYLGARENTKAQMSATMQFADLDAVELGRAFGDIQKQLTLRMASKLFGDHTYKFLDEFQSMCQQFYGAEVEAVDFRADKNKAACVINNFVAHATNDMIKDIISTDDITDLTKLVLINAVYFKGNWFNRFEANNTKERKFYITRWKKRKVPMMFIRRADFRYGHNDKLRCKAIELPYVGAQLSMYVFLPDSLCGLADVEKALTVDVLADIQGAFGLMNTYVKLYLPKFKLTDRIELSQVLAEMGMGDLFAQCRADLSGIDGSKELFVSQILHRGVVSVDEEGTEATAATENIFLGCSLLDSVPKVQIFRADHPFLFVIYDNASLSVVFIGRVTDPR